MANSARPDKQSRPPATGLKWLTLRIPVLLVTVLVLLMGAAIYFQTTLVVGTELHSLTWQVRGFSFRQDPFTKLQLTGITHTAPSYSNFWTVLPDDSVKPAAAISSLMTVQRDLPPGRWDLVQLNDSRNSQGPAAILVRLARAQGLSSKDFWLVWTGAEPVKAAELWPAVQRLVAFGLYPKLPAIFELATYESDDVAFLRALNDRMLAIMAQHCEQLIADGKLEAARLAAKTGLAYGDSPVLQKIVDEQLQSSR